MSFFILYGAPRIISLHTILGPPDHFLRLLHGAPQIGFFSYNMGAPLRSVSLFTIRGPPQISFFACYRRGHLTFYFFHKIYGGPLRSVSPLTIWGPLRLVYFIYGVLQISFCAYFLRAPLRSVFSLTIRGHFRSVSSHTIWGAPQISFFAYYMGVP